MGLRGAPGPQARQQLRQRQGTSSDCGCARERIAGGGTSGVERAGKQKDVERAGTQKDVEKMVADVENAVKRRMPTAELEKHFQQMLAEELRTVEADEAVRSNNRKTGLNATFVRMQASHQSSHQKKEQKDHNHKALAIVYNPVVDVFLQQIG